MTLKRFCCGNDINITKTADKGSFNLTVKVVDEWGREYTKAYAISVINVVIPVTSLELTEALTPFSSLTAISVDLTIAPSLSASERVAF